MKAEKLYFCFSLTFFARESQEHVAFDVRQKDLRCSLVVHQGISMLITNVNIAPFVTKSRRHLGSYLSASVCGSGGLAAFLGF